MYELIQPAYRTALTTHPARLARELKRDLDSRGIAMLPDFFAPVAMEQMRETVRQCHERCLGGAKRKHLIGDDLKGTIFFDFARAEWVRAICNPILRPFGYQVDTTDVHPVLALLQGDKAKDAIHNYHFDATFLTLAVPVIMPDTTSPARGPFRIWPNVRRFSTGWLQEKFYWRVMRVPWLRDRFPSLSIHFEPGSLYFFYGFRSWHGTGDLDETSLRANCLINVGGPYFYKDTPLLPRSQRTEP